MANGGVMAISVILGFMVIIGMHWYYPENALSQVVEEATMNSPVTKGFAFGSIISFSVGILIEYFIVVLAIYLFFRSVTRSFGNR
jgi:hypothetical protein